MKTGEFSKLSLVVSGILLAGIFSPIEASAAGDPCLSSVAIIGTSGDDEIVGTPGDDIICTLAGNDVITSLAGDDVIIAGDGDDRIITVEGNDYVEAGDGADFIDSGAGNDEIQGNAGDDIMWGGNDVDLLMGFAGKDSLDGGQGSDTLDGGEDRNYCVPDKKDKKTTGCFYDSKAPRLTAFSVSPDTRVIDTSVSAQWVRVKAVVAEAGSGLVEAGFYFVNWANNKHAIFGANGSIASRDRLPVTCSSFSELIKTPPPNTANPKSYWCVNKSSPTGVIVEFLIPAPYRLPKGDYSFSGITLVDGALNRSSQNGANFNVKVRQTASVPTGDPVLKAFEFISPNKVNTAAAAQLISAEATFATGPVGLGSVEITFHRDVDRAGGDNPITMIYNMATGIEPCNSKMDKSLIKETCLLSETDSTAKIIFVASLPKNSPTGTYRFSFLSISSKTGKGKEITYESLKADLRYQQFTKLSIVQTAASSPLVVDGRIELVGIEAVEKYIDTGMGPATIRVQVKINRTGKASNWNLQGYVHAMYCASGTIRKFNSIKISNPLTAIQAGEYCSSLNSHPQGKRIWWPDAMASNTISTGGNFMISPGSNSTEVALTIPANFKKGTIIVGLDQMHVDIGENQYASLRGNWNADSIFGSKNKYPTALTCGIYPSCTKYYSVLKNGK